MVNDGPINADQYIGHLSEKSRTISVGPCYRKIHFPFGGSMRSLALIYGKQIDDDIKFCKANEAVICRYHHGLMTLQGSPINTLREIAKDPMSVPGWKISISESPGDALIISDFLTRMANHFENR